MDLFQIVPLLYVLASIFVVGFVLIMIFRFVKAVEKIASTYTEKQQ